MYGKTVWTSATACDKVPPWGYTPLSTFSPLLFLFFGSYIMFPAVFFRLAHSCFSLLLLTSWHFHSLIDRMSYYLLVYLSRLSLDIHRVHFYIFIIYIFLIISWDAAGINFWMLLYSNFFIESIVFVDATVMIYDCSYLTARIVRFFQRFALIMNTN